MNTIPSTSIDPATATSANGIVAGHLSLTQIKRWYNALTNLYNKAKQDKTDVTFNTKYLEEYTNILRTIYKEVILAIPKPTGPWKRFVSKIGSAIKDCEPAADVTVTADNIEKLSDLLQLILYAYEQSK